MPIFLTDDPERNLEIATEEPNLTLIMSELESAQTDIEWYLSRNAQAYNWWHAKWPGQTTSGRKEDEDAFPWPNSSDARIRTVKQVIRDHVMLAKAAFINSKIQGKSMRPFSPGQTRRSNQVTKILQWEMNVHMRANLQREVPLALNWRFGYGAAVLNVEWVTRQRLQFHELTLETLAEFIALQEGLSEEDFPALMAQLIDAMADPGQEETLASYVQGLSPQLLNRTKARSLVNELRAMGPEDKPPQVPVPYVFQSLPVWTALRPGVEILFPALLYDFQTSRWTARYESVTETELKDRYETDNYDKAFIAEALRHKGAGADSLWRTRTLAERSGNYGGSSLANDNENRIDLIHFDLRASYDGVPCSYRTVFCPQMVSRSGKQLYARHSREGYKHGRVPFVDLRMEKEERPLLSSQGIAENAYTHEQAIKKQLDGVTDRTDVMLRPPMITHYSKVHAIKGQPIPGAVMGASRPQETQWFPPPPMDQTPTLVMEFVFKLIDRQYPLFGAEIDPELKRAYREDLVGDILGESQNAIEQTFQLMQERLPEDQAAAVAGQLQRPFQVSQQEIQLMHEITVYYDPRSLEDEYVQKKVQLLQEAMLFNRSGNADMSGIFRNIIEWIDPDAADEMVLDDTEATDRERTDEQNALALMLSGIEPDKPLHCNHQLRLQTLNEKLQQNPRIMQRLAQSPDVWELIQNRVEFHQNQIQQYQENPQIGKALSTQTFNKKAAPQLSMAGS